MAVRLAAKKDPTLWAKEMKALGSLPLRSFVISVPQEKSKNNLELVTDQFDSLEIVNMAERVLEGLAILDASSHLLDETPGKDLASLTSELFDVFQTARLHQIQTFMAAIHSEQQHESMAIFTRPRDGKTLIFRVLGRKRLAQDVQALVIIDVEILNQLSRSSIETLKPIADAAPFFCVVLNANIELLYANEIAIKVLGISEVHLKNSFGCFLSPRGMTTLLKASRDLGAPTSGRVVSDQIHLKSPSNQKEFHMPSTISMIAGASGDSAQYFLVMGVYSEELNRLKESANQRERLLQVASQQLTLGKIANHVIHEIMNPITVIAGKAEKIHHAALAEPVDQELFRQASERILAMTRHLEKIIHSVKKIGHVEVGRARTVVSLAELMNDLREILEVGARKSGISLAIAGIAPDLSIRADVVKISQALVNLVNNAVDAVRDLDDKWVRIEAKGEKELIAIKVIDSGQGIPADIAQHMFDSYFTTKPIGAGTGIGLSFSRQMIRDEGGDLVYDPGAAHTTFIIYLPCAASQDEDPKSSEEEIEEI